MDHKIVIKRFCICCKSAMIHSSCSYTKCIIRFRAGEGKEGVLPTSKRSMGLHTMKCALLTPLRHSETNTKKAPPSLRTNEASDLVRHVLPPEFESNINSRIVVVKKKIDARKGRLFGVLGFHHRSRRRRWLLRPWSPHSHKTWNHHNSQTRGTTYSHSSVLSNNLYCIASLQCSGRMSVPRQDQQSSSPAALRACHCCTHALLVQFDVDMVLRQQCGVVEIKCWIRHQLFQQETVRQLRPRQNITNGALRKELKMEYHTIHHKVHNFSKSEGVMDDVLMIIFCAMYDLIPYLIHCTEFMMNPMSNQTQSLPQ
jgi:hypothetical protein